MKKFGWIIAVVIVLVGIYSALWVFQARALEKGMLDELAEISKESKNTVVLNYDRIDRSGYPFSIAFSFVNPRFSAGIEPQKVEVGVQGDITNTFTVLGRLKNVAVDGMVNVNAPGMQQTLFEGKASIASSFKGFIPRFIIHPLSTKKSDFEELTLSISPFKWVSPSGVAAVTIENTVLHYQNKPSSQLVDVKANVMVDLPVANALMGMPTGMEEPVSEGTKDVVPLYMLVQRAINDTLATKTNFAVDLSAEIPSQEFFSKISSTPIFGLFSLTLPTFSLHVKNFTSTNVLSTSTCHGRIALTEDNKKTIHFQFGHDTKTEWSPEFYTRAMACLDEISAGAKELHPQDETLKRLKELLVNHIDDVKALVPKMQLLGTQVSMSKGSLDFNKENFNFASELSKSGLQNNLFGILLHGDAKHEGGEFAYSFTLDLLNYKELVNDLTNYFNHICVVFNQLKDSKTSMLNPLTEETKNKVLAYLQDISNTPQEADKDAHITASYVKGELKIGTMNFFQFMQSSRAVGDAICTNVCPAPSAPQQPAQPPVVIPPSSPEAVPTPTP